MSPSVNTNTWSVLLAGGVGARFWPMSREARPKQLLDLFGDGPMLRTTFERALALAPAERTLVVTSSRLADEVARLLPEIPRSHILCEPSGKNTAPAIAWAAAIAADHDPDARLVVLPSDHFISDIGSFHQVAAHALALTDHFLVTIGIVPTHPETGFGYIERGPTLARPDAPTAAQVVAFSEKPDLLTATRYLAGGRHLWNAGMFFMRAAHFLSELAHHRPALGALVAQHGPRLVDVWDQLESISIDYAVMEHSQQVAVVPGSFGWSDVGSWASLFDHRAPNAGSFHAGDVLEIRGTNNVLFASGGTVTTLDVTDLIVVHTPDATFVAPRDASQNVREIVAALRATGRQDLL